MAKLTPFSDILKLAETRKGGPAALRKLLPKPISSKQLEKIPDDRYLAMMVRCVFNAGFHWRVITNKWPGFEEAFHGFNPRGLAHMAPEKWEAYLEDKRIVRNWTKIQSVLENAHFVMEVSEQHGSFGKFIAQWPSSEQIGLLEYLKQHGSRLGGNTAMYFLRFIGKDSFILSRDVIGRLQASGVEIRDNPTSKKEMRLIQAAFNQWHEQSGLPYTHLSRIASFSIGENYPNV